MLIMGRTHRVLIVDQLRLELCLRFFTHRIFRMVLIIVVFTAMHYFTTTDTSPQFGARKATLSGLEYWSC